MFRFLLSISLLLSISPAYATADNPWRQDALEFEDMVNARYAYLDRLESPRFQLTAKLRDEATKVDSQWSLLKFAERALLLLADHHAITGSSFSDSWAVVPSYSDLWIERKDGTYRVTSVRARSAAATAMIMAGDQLVKIGNTDIEDAVTSFWRDLGFEGNIDNDRAGFAARILVAGRRDRERQLTVRSPGKAGNRLLNLATLYANRSDLKSVETAKEGPALRVTFNDSLGNRATIEAFDAEMAKVKKGQTVIIDLSNTPSGGNTVIARAIMGWFVKEPKPFQVHRSPSEERETGIARQWIEQVLPRGKGKYHNGKIIVRVGRWTGSMGEGLAIGFAALGARVEGDQMAGLLGAIEDIALPNSKLIVKLPTERLYSVNGIPREQFRPKSAKAK